MCLSLPPEIKEGSSFPGVCGTSGSLGLLWRQKLRSLESLGRSNPALGGWCWVLCACQRALGTSGLGQGDEAEATGR